MKTNQRNSIKLFSTLIISSLLISSFVQAQTGTVLSHQKISDLQGGFPSGQLDNSDILGRSVANIGDLDGDGVDDIATGAFQDDDGGFNKGAIWILFLNSNGTVKTAQKISDTQGGFTGGLKIKDTFGVAIEPIGDLDGDGIVDIAVGAVQDDDGGTDRGAVWILFLNTDGTVKSQQKISDTQGNFTGVLNNSDRFGIGIAALNDLDGDGVNDIAVGARDDDDGGTNQGAIWVLFLNSDGTVKSHQKISEIAGLFTGSLDNVDGFAAEIAPIGDLNGDNIMDIAVSAHRDDDGGTDRGAVWILFLNNNGTVNSHQKISATAGGFSGPLMDGDNFGFAITEIGDLDRDGVVDLAVGADFDDDGGFRQGAIWILFLNSDGTVKGHQKISETTGNFAGVLDPSDLFGHSLASLGDLNNDGITDIITGAELDDDGGTNKGALWVLFLNGPDCQNFPCGKNGQKVQMCHIPPGNSTNAHEICVSPNAVDAHLAHGDFCGPCSSSSKNDQSDLGKAELLVQRERVSIYPNPFTNSFFIELNQDMIIENEHIEVRIYDLFGRTVKTVNNLSTESLEIDLSGMCRGLYNYNILSDKGFVKTGKILKE